MSAKIIGVAEFKAKCLGVIDEMVRDHQPVTITKRGKPVAVLTPIAAEPARSIIGAMEGSVLRYDDPFAPALDPAEWNANR
ncbi:MAG TPA: type II toxin-antitoxin system prevent-host-death family antitoxin [Caulobacteraceae bacterium]